MDTEKNWQKYGTIPGRVLILGFGSIGQPILPLILRHLEVDPKKITVLELGEHKELFEERWAQSGVTFVATRILQDNLDSEVSKYVGEDGDFLIDCSLNIDGPTIIKWCLEHGVKYVNTSIERWENKPDETIPDLAERTLYAAHRDLRKDTAEYKGKGPTCVVIHGANPGLVTHFTKQALLDIAKAMGHSVKVPQTQVGWARLLKLTGTKVIQVSERDTQVIDKPKVKGEFVNTWSCEGFWAEGRAPAELGWGTHEDELPENGDAHTEGPKNAVYLKQPGVATLMKGWVPIGGSYNGFLIQHSEAITISEYFSLMEGDKCVWRPTVYYCYCPCDAAVVSAHEFRGQELEMQTVKRIAKDEIVSGIDELGVLLLGHAKNAWWFGSQLSIDQARELVEHESATSIQVASSMLGAIVWALKNPNMGVVEPEELPFQEVLAVALPYLGKVVSLESDWTPLDDRNTLFRKKLDPKHPWKFINFTVGS
jgi:homospermidine synthase